MYRVIIADDEPFVREGLKEMIPWEELGYSLEGAFKNGKEAVDAVEKISPDVVILDIQMPVMNGLEAALEIRRKWPDIIVILLTAYEDFQYAQQAIVLQIKRYVIKSNLLEDLPKVLEEIGEEMKKENSADQKRKEIFRMLLEESEYLDLELELEDSVELRWFYNSFENFRLLVFKGYREETETIDSLKEKMLDKISRLFEDCRIFIMNTSTTECTVLLSDADNMTRDLLENRCKELLASEKFFLFAGISDVYAGISNVSIAYRMALNSIRRYFLNLEKSHQGVVFSEKKKNLDHHELNKRVFEAISEMEKGNQEKGMEALERFCASMESYSDAYIYTAVILFISECYRICIEQGWERNSYFDAEQEKVIHILAESRKYYELEECMKNMMQFLIQKRQEENQNANSLIDVIDQYIDQNIMKKLNLDLIAEAVHANRCYISRIYKERTGEKLFDRINRKKIKIAQKYIEDGNMKIYEIAGMTGWEDTAYFSRVFKKYTGYAPKEYERMCRRQEGCAE